MKRWWILIAGLLAAVICGDSLFRGTDVAQMEPVELIFLDLWQGMVRIETDTGSMGEGTDLETAVQDMQESAQGKIFLDTADYLVISLDAEQYLKSLGPYLRPSVRICLTDDDIDPQKAAAYLKIHEPKVSLLDLGKGRKEMQKIKLEGERMYLVSD